MFLANHSARLDSLAILAALYEEGKKHNFRPVIRPVLRDDTFICHSKEYSFLNPLFKAINFGVNFFGENSGALIIKKRSKKTGKYINLNKKKRKNALLSYRTALKKRQNVLIFPKGDISKDGRVDDENSCQIFNNEHLELLFNYVDNLNVRFVNSTYDPMTMRHLVSVGKIVPKREIRYVDFTREIGKCTIVTPLQVAAYLIKNGKGLDVNRFDEFVDNLEQEGYYIYRNGRGSEEIFELLKGRLRKRVKRLGNEIAHLDLESKL